MRRLVHVKIIHDLPSSRIKEIDSRRAKAIQKFHNALSNTYDDISEYFLKMHEQDPFHRVYVENFDGVYTKPEDISNLTAIYYKPIKALMEHGVELTQTERPTAALIFKYLVMIFDSHEKAFDNLKKLKKIPTKDGIKIFENLIERESLEEFFGGLSYFDYHAGRENWIGRNIERTLEEDKQGILFLGKGHRSYNILKQLTNVTYHTYKPFDFL